MFLVGIVGGALNSVAGGGSLVTFPTLNIAFGVADKLANATNTVGIWPASLTGGLGFLNQLKGRWETVRMLMLPSIVGAIIGGWLLLVTPETTFQLVVPLLIFVAAILLLLQPKIKELVGSGRKLPTWAVTLLQLLISLYGGYFGAGMGIMMLAVLGMYVEGDLHELNAIKNWLGLLINLFAAIFFVAKGMVIPGFAMAIMLGSAIGGYTGARLSQKLDANKLRVIIGVYGLLMSAYFFFR